MPRLQVLQAPVTRCILACSISCNDTETVFCCHRANCVVLRQKTFSKKWEIYRLAKHDMNRKKTFTCSTTWCLLWIPACMFARLTQLQVWLSSLLAALEELCPQKVLASACRYIVSIYVLCNESFENICLAQDGSTLCCPCQICLNQLVKTVNQYTWYITCIIMHITYNKHHYRDTIAYKQLQTKSRHWQLPQH